MWNITLLWLFCCPVLSSPVLSCPVMSWLYFFSRNSAQVEPLDGIYHLWLKWRVVTQGCAFWVFEWQPIILRGSKPPKTPKKGAWLGIFQPKWQNYKMVISPAENIGSIPNFDIVIEPHSWLRGWSIITKFIFKMADGRHIAEYWKRYSSPINRPICIKLGWSHPIMSPICPHDLVAMATGVA